MVFSAVANNHNMQIFVDPSLYQAVCFSLFLTTTLLTARKKDMSPWALNVGNTVEVKSENSPGARRSLLNDKLIIRLITPKGVGFTSLGLNLHVGRDFDNLVLK